MEANEKMNFRYCIACASQFEAIYLLTTAIALLITMVEIAKNVSQSLKRELLPVERVPPVDGSIFIVVFFAFG